MPSANLGMFRFGRQARLSWLMAGGGGMEGTATNTSAAAATLASSAAWNASSALEGARGHLQLSRLSPVVSGGRLVQAAGVEVGASEEGRNAKSPFAEILDVTEVQGRSALGIVNEVTFKDVDKGCQHALATKEVSITQESDIENAMRGMCFAINVATSGLTTFRIYRAFLDDIGRSMHILMEKAPLYNLKDYLKDYKDGWATQKKPGLLFTEATMVHQIMKTIYLSKEKGITHGNVNLETLVVTKPSKPGQGPQVRLADWGFGCVTCPAKAHREPAYYLPPEVKVNEKKPLSPASDIWAVGVVLHWLVFRKPPACLDNGDSTECVDKYKVEDWETYEQLGEEPAWAKHVRDMLKLIFIPDPINRTKNFFEVAWYADRMAVGLMPEFIGWQDWHGDPEETQEPPEACSNPVQMQTGDIKTKIALNIDKLSQCEDVAVMRTYAKAVWEKAIELQEAEACRDSGETCRWGCMSTGTSCKKDKGTGKCLCDKDMCWDTEKKSCFSPSP